MRKPDVFVDVLTPCLTSVRLSGAIRPIDLTINTIVSVCVFFFPLCSEWYLNGNYLVVIVSLAVILPLALMKQLGECGSMWLHVE